MSKAGDQKPVYLVAIPDDNGGERWLTADAEAPGGRVAVAFGTEEEATAYARRHVSAIVKVVEFARVPEPSEE